MLPAVEGLTDQVTVPPLPETVAENCSTAPPDEFVPLHPVQLVSMATEPGVIDKLPLPPEAPPPPQPAINSAAGTVPSASARPSARPSA
jgi:hypothetical protein